MKPDLLVCDAVGERLVLDTKWKLLDGLQSSSTEKYGLSQGDFYQLYAYGQSYLGGEGDVVLVFPRTAAFDRPLPVFEFAATETLRLWVLPFCLRERMLLLPACGSLNPMFSPGGAQPAAIAPSPDRRTEMRELV